MIWILGEVANTTLVRLQPLTTTTKYTTIVNIYPLIRCVLSTYKRNRKTINTTSPCSKYTQLTGIEFSEFAFLVFIERCNCCFVVLVVETLSFHRVLEAGDRRQYARVDVVFQAVFRRVSLNRLSVGCGTTPRRQSGDSAGF